MNKGNGKAEAWLTTFTKTARAQLPEGKYLITHARESSRTRLRTCTYYCSQLSLHGE